MARKSPSRIRKDLEAARNRVKSLIGLLEQNKGERRWGLGDECARATAALNKLLDKNEAPVDYKVAVIGRFKAGKSSFVNVLLDRTLAGVGTNPETAAVTTFRYGASVVAKINLVDRSSWDELKKLHQAEPADPEAYRVANWFKFAKEARAQSASQDAFDLEAIERDHVFPRGHSIEVRLSDATTVEERRKAETEFHRRIRQYTSSTRPYHCLVESIEIEAPSILLDEGVTLVDTPGLDDTERFRVQLTDRAIQDVDAVLYLTKSGPSYGQSEKDFVLSLLRKGAIKQLIFVVTQVDQTYEQHVNQARDEGEDPEPIVVHIDAERRRLRRALEETLVELAVDGNSAAAARYSEQLSSFEIAFTSARNHIDHMRKELVRFPIATDDPGGMHNIKDALYRVLSAESRLAATKAEIQRGVATILDELLSVIEKRRAIIGGLKSSEVAEQKLATFRSEFEANGRRFSEATEDAAKVLTVTLANRREPEVLTAEIVSHQAEEVLASYEVDDAGRHWKTRRSGYWGYLDELQIRIANRIFPKVAEELSKKTDAFEEFVDKFRVHLKSLSDESNAAVARLEIGNELQLDISSDLEAFLRETLGSLQELIVGEETKIVDRLEKFVDQEVANRISAARGQVTDIVGRGTTVAQTTQVKSFYREVRSILKDSLKTHVNARFGQFADHLLAHANGMSGDALSQVRVRIEQTAIDIRAAAKSMVTGDKEAFNRAAAELSDTVAGGKTEILTLLDDQMVDGEIVVEPAAPVPSTPVVVPVASEDGSPPDSIRARATRFVARHDLKNGAKGWPLAKIFDRSHLQGASEGWLVDPFLAMHFQRRNLSEFVLTLLEGAKLKAFHIVTREKNDLPEENNQEYFRQLDKDAYEKGGMRIDMKVDDTIHDRYVVLDNGYVFKLGRGLDIYKPAVGMARRDQSLRQVRACEIDVFAPEPK